MALFVRWRGFLVNLFLFPTKHQLVGIFLWIVGRRLLCTLYWSACILEDLLGTGINYYCADYFHFRGVWEVNNSVTVSPIPSTPKRANIVYNVIVLLGEPDMALQELESKFRDNFFTLITATSPLSKLQFRHPGNLWHIFLFLCFCPVFRVERSVNEKQEICMRRKKVVTD